MVFDYHQNELKICQRGKCCVFRVPAPTLHVVHWSSREPGGGRNRIFGGIGALGQPGAGLGSRQVRWWMIWHADDNRGQLIDVAMLSGDWGKKFPNFIRTAAFPN